MITEHASKSCTDLESGTRWPTLYPADRTMSQRCHKLKNEKRKTELGQLRLDRSTISEPHKERLFKTIRHSLKEATDPLPSQRQANGGNPFPWISSHSCQKRNLHWTRSSYSQTDSVKWHTVWRRPRRCRPQSWHKYSLILFFDAMAHASNNCF